jgi:hypothetical protein
MTEFHKVLMTLGSEPVGSLAHRALTGDCVFQLLAIVSLVAGYRQMRRTESLVREIADAFLRSMDQKDSGKHVDMVFDSILRELSQRQRK